MNKTSTLITSAGMPRSASTWMYNVIRMLIASQPDLASDFSFGWIGDWKKIPKKRHILIKAHNFDPDLVKVSKVIFYSYRDIRDAIASQQRKFGGVASLIWADQFIESHEKWIKAANFSMKYESMLQKKEDIVLNISKTLEASQIYSRDSNVIAVKITDIIGEIERLNFDSEGEKNSNNYNENNLFHKNHITDGRYGAYKDDLSQELISQITDKYRWWLEEYNYEL